jgi:hypothetical protein
MIEHVKLINKNYPKVKDIFEHQLSHFTELTSLRNEILNCLLLELGQASIFATNHFLERIIKLALIKKYTIGLNYSTPDLYNSKTLEAISKYDNEILANTLKFANTEKLINDDEYSYLKGLKDKIRNPYSHAEIKKIIQGAPKHFTGVMFNFKEINESLQKGEPIKPGVKTEITTLSSTFSQLYQKSFSEGIAYQYFNDVYTILKKLEERLSNLMGS